jgi:hypothetical protein
VLSKVERSEDLVAWQKARDLTRAIYQVTQQGAFAKDLGLARQIQRAAVSIMSNVTKAWREVAEASFISFFPLPTHHVQTSVHTCTLPWMLAVWIGRRLLICSPRQK